MRCQAVGPFGAAHHGADGITRWPNGPCLCWAGAAPGADGLADGWVPGDVFVSLQRQLGHLAGFVFLGWQATASECFSEGSGGPSRATEQGVQADEAPLEAGRGMVVGRERGSVVTVWVPASSGASQLNAGVRPT